MARDRCDVCGERVVITGGSKQLTDSFSVRYGVCSGCGENKRIGVTVGNTSDLHSGNEEWRLISVLNEIKGLLAAEKSTDH